MGILPNMTIRIPITTSREMATPPRVVEWRVSKVLLFNLAIRHQQGLFPSDYRTQRKCHRILNMSTPCFSRRNVRSWLWSPRWSHSLNESKLVRVPQISSPLLIQTAMWKAQHVNYAKQKKNRELRVYCQISHILVLGKNHLRAVKCFILFKVFDRLG